MKIKYVGYFDSSVNEGQARAYALSAASKIRYIARVLNDIGYEVQIVSPSQTTSSHGFPGKSYSLNRGTEVSLFRTFGSGTKPRRLLNLVWSQISLLVYLLRATKRDETVLAYHSLYLQFPLFVALKIKRFRLVLEVEEIYQDVVNVWAPVGWVEYATIRSASAYVFATEMLNDRLNPKLKPFTVIYGSYDVPTRRVERPADGLIHLVYAGTLDPRKGNLSCLEAMRFLDSKFHLHILGIGNRRELEAVESRLAAIRAETDCLISLDSPRTGDAFTDYLHTCAIGLATQDADARFNQTSFPSKILTYLAHGLEVVATRIPAVEVSAVAERVYFCDSSDPEVIADSVRRAAVFVSESAPFAGIDNLDDGFHVELLSLISNGGHGVDA